MKDEDFTIDDAAVRKEVRDVLYSVVQDNIANDFNKLNSNTEGDKFDHEFSVNKDFTENLQQAMMDEIVSKTVEDEFRVMMDPKYEEWKLYREILHWSMCSVNYLEDETMKTEQLQF